MSCANATCQGCGHVWKRDPSLEVACPTCNAEIGHECTVLRPSQHRHSKGFAGLPDWGHDARELLAAAENKYGCGCGVSPEEARRRLNHLLASGETKWKRPERSQVADTPLFAGAAQ